MSQRQQVAELKATLLAECEDGGRPFMGDPEDLLMLVNQAIDVRVRTVLAAAIQSMGRIGPSPPAWIDTANGTAHDAEIPFPEPYGESYDDLVFGFPALSPEQQYDKAKASTSISRSALGPGGLYPRMAAIDRLNVGKDSASLASIREAVATSIDPAEADPELSTEDEEFNMLSSTLEQAVAELKGDQIKAYDMLLSWLSMPYFEDDNKFLVKGFAGTGKTFLLNVVRKLCAKIGITVYLSAPTNKAAKQISGATEEVAKTTQSILGLRMVAEGDKMVLKRQKDAHTYFPRGSLLVIDEGSILDKPLIAIILEEAKRHGLRILLLGDTAQLPPVGEKISSVWKLIERDDRQVLMKTVQRYKNALLAESMAIRRSLRDRVPHGVYESRLNKDGTGVHLLTRSAFLKKSLLKEPADYLKSPILCWRNDTVRDHIKRVRAHFGYKEAEAWVPGEPGLTKSPTFKGRTVLDSTSTEFIVDAVSAEIWEKEDQAMHFWLLHSSQLEKGFVKVPKKLARFEALKSQMAADARARASEGVKHAWAEFWEFVNEFTPCEHAYALTVHNSQGSTFEQVYVDQKDISECSEVRTRNSLYYVSFTRAQINAYTF